MAEQGFVLDGQAGVDPQQRRVPGLVEKRRVLFQPTHDPARPLVAFPDFTARGPRSSRGYFGRGRVTHGTILTRTCTKTVPSIEAQRAGRARVRAGRSRRSRPASAGHTRSAVASVGATVGATVLASID